MPALMLIAQRFLPLGAVVIITLLGHRFVPPGVGILPRIFIITGIVIVGLWIVSKGLKTWQARQVRQ
jgi:hypothetical protein